MSKVPEILLLRSGLRLRTGVHARQENMDEISETENAGMENYCGRVDMRAVDIIGSAAKLKIIE